MTPTVLPPPSPPVLENDRLLQPFLGAPDDAAAQAHLGYLLHEVAAPRVRRIIVRKVGTPKADTHRGDPLDVEDITANAVGLLLRRLLALRAGEGKPVRDFLAYCGVSAQSAWVDHLRLLRPARARLIHQVRYLLAGEQRDRGFALWIPLDAEDSSNCSGDEWCGFKAWHVGLTPPAAPERLRALADDPGAFLEPFLARPEEALRMDPARLLAGIFDRLGGPAPLEAVVDAVGALWDSGDAATRQEPATAPADLPAPLPGPDDAVAWSDYLRWLWEAVRGLGLAQRFAFILHSDVTKEWAWRNVAAPADIAATLELPPAELEALWPDIPLPDAVTAERLGISRQQVINLRKAARIVLGRKFKEMLTAPPVLPPSCSTPSISRA